LEKTALKVGIGIRSLFNALERCYKLDPYLFRVNPEEFRNMTCDKIADSV